MIGKNELLLFYIASYSYKLSIFILPSLLYLADIGMPWKALYTVYTFLRH